MGERALQLGIEDPSLVGAIAAKVGLSGHAVIVVRDEREAATGTLGGREGWRAGRCAGADRTPTCRSRVLRSTSSFCMPPMVSRSRFRMPRPSRRCGRHIVCSDPVAAW